MTMAEKVRGAMGSILHWWPIIVSCAGLLVGGATWYQRMSDRFDAIDKQFISISKSAEKTDKKIEAIQMYLMTSHAATTESPALPQYNVYPKTPSKQPTPAVKHSQNDPFEIFAAQTYQFAGGQLNPDQK